MDKFKEIRPIVLAIIKRNGKLLVQEGINSNTHFYRCLGGGIEFQEKAQEALKREFKEEIGADILVGNYLGMIENIFTLNERQAHELILVYEASLPEQFYKPAYQIPEGERKIPATWVDIEEFTTHKKMLYPEEILSFLF